MRFGSGLASGLGSSAGLNCANDSRTLAFAEHAPKNIRVNCLCPVAGETGMLATFMGEDTPEMRAQFKSVIPLGRFSTPRGIGTASLCVCSDEAVFVTDVTLDVDRGRWR